MRGDENNAPIFKCTSSQGGQIVVDVGTGAFTYQPPEAFAGEETFQYELSDDYGTSSEATITIVVTNSVPLVMDESYDTRVWHAGLPPLSIPKEQGLLANDLDDDSDTLSVVATGTYTTSEGTWSIAADGSFDFTPALGFVGTATFSYTVSDGAASGLSSAMVFVNVISDPPVAMPHYYSLDLNSFAPNQSPFVSVDVDHGLFSGHYAHDDTARLTLSVTSPEAGQGSVTMAVNNEGAFTQGHRI